jgi:mono/diheme cytochrome c family protein
MRLLGVLAVLGWLSAAQCATPTADGKALFEKKCSVCHASETSEHRIGPSLKGLKEGKLPDAYGRPADHDHILKQIDGGGNGMPVFRNLLTKEQKEAIIQYVMTL